MELQIKEYRVPEAIQFNFEELKQELEERVSEYTTLVYTADAIRQGKSDRAKLNALKKSLNDERIRLEREWMEPFQMFKSQVNELIGIVDQAVKAVDSQVQEFESMKKQEKYEQIMALWQEILHDKYDWLNPQQVWNDKWLNASYSFKQIQKDLEEWDQKITADLGILGRMPEYSFEAQETYKRTLKLDDAMWTADNLKQMAEAKAQQDAARQPDLGQEQPAKEAPEEFMAPPIPPENEANTEPVQVLRFQCFCTMDQAMRLRAFMVENGIKFERC